MLLYYLDGKVNEGNANIKVTQRVASEVTNDEEIMKRLAKVIPISYRPIRYIINET